jgi:formate hydrogenlyase transcriptional activator
MVSHSDRADGLGTPLFLDQLLHDLALQLRQYVSFDYISLVITGAETPTLMCCVVDAESSEQCVQPAFSDELFAWVGEHPDPAIAPHVEGHAQLGTLNRSHGVNSLLSMPLKTANRTLGVILFGSLECSFYKKQDLEFLDSVAYQIRATALLVENAVLEQENRAIKRQLNRESVYLEENASVDARFHEIVGRSNALQHVLAEIETVARTEATVLICGETGTGKELIARAIHNLGARNQRDFVKLNCAAIPTGLLESELFGHERGAFTGAVTQRIGRFEAADRGTIFLDEIGEIPVELQTKLLRVLQEQEFERLGSTRTIQTDVRLIAATNRDLLEMVEEQNFRADLFYRLNVYPIRVPSLRERAEDIPLLVRYFVRHFTQRMSKLIDTIPSATIDALVAYRWPGNIRELQNVIERAVIRSSGPSLQVPLDELQDPGLPHSSKFQPKTLEEVERENILAALQEAKWVIAGPNGAAARLGMNRCTVEFRMKKLGIVKPWRVQSKDSITV